MIAQALASSPLELPWFVNTPSLCCIDLFKLEHLCICAFSSKGFIGQQGWGGHIGMPLICEMVLVKKLELEATEINLKNNKQKLHTPALVYKWKGLKSPHNM